MNPDSNPEPSENPGWKLQWRLWTGVFLLCLILLSYLWIRSWTRIDSRFLSIGPGGVEFCSAGSSLAMSIMADPIPALDFGDALGPPDADHLLHYEAKWADGGSVGRVADSCLFYPDVETVSQVQLHRIGSFGGSFAWPSMLQVRIPYWFVAVALIGGTIWLEFSSRRSSSG